MRRFLLGGLAIAAIAAVAAWFFLVPRSVDVVQQRAVAPPDELDAHCRDAIGPPRVVEIGDRVLVAIGYDLANTMLIRTDAGHVVVDVGMSPARAAQARAALLERAPGAVAAVIYTHSHIDHVGGASAWVGTDTPIWATSAFTAHFLKQYGLFRPAETRRAARQFGVHVHEESLPCAALGRRIDLEAATRTGARLPTHTFDGAKTLEIGGVRIELVEAHGETHDQLFVWLPESRVLMPGDNYYRAFPNLYTIRGTAPRPVDRWIRSLDEMRRRAPLHLVPSHTVPISGEAEIRAALTRYRDGIQWVRDRVVAAANAGHSIDAIAAEVGLPPQLADDPALRPLYGQVDWSVRAIYGGHLGWFDGRPEALYPLTAQARAEKTIAAMGGAQAVAERAAAAVGGDPRWALHLFALLDDAGEAPAPGTPPAEARADALEALAATVGNTNGRGYLLESAHELRAGQPALPTPRPEAVFLDGIPMSVFFQTMATRLSPARSLEAFETVHFEFTDTDERFVVTVRRGVAEMVEGEPLPGTPEPIARVRTDTATWRRIALKMMAPAEAVADGALAVEGDAAAFFRFSKRFDRGI